MKGNRGAKGVTVLSLCGILTDAVKSRIAGGNAASVKIPVATQHSKKRRESVCRSARSPGFKTIQVSMQHNCMCRCKEQREKLQFLVLMTAQGFSGHGPSPYCH